jgi:AraC-like DNA-binding protein
LTDFIARIGFTEAQLLDPNTRVPREGAVGFTNELIALIGDPEVGLRLAERFELRDVDLFGYLVRHCPHPLGAMEELARYSRLIGDSIDCQVEVRNQRVIVAVGLLGERHMSPEIVDYFIGTICRTIRDLTRGSVNPLEVHLARPEPRRPGRYESFFSAPVKFNAKCCALYYSVEAMRTPFAEADDRLRKLLEQRADTLLSELPPRCRFLDQVRRRVNSQLELKELTARDLARQMGMSERTLRRRLEENGLSYRQILDDVRRENALRLAKDCSYNVTMIAYRIGYADTSKFARAFRRWTGMAPAAYLKKARGKIKGRKKRA